MPNKVVNFKNQNSDSLFRFYRPMLIILLFCGYNFDVLKNNLLYTVIIRLYCCSLVALVIFASMTCCSKDLTKVWSLFEYAISVILILFFQSSTKTFLSRLQDIDSYLRINKRQHTFAKYKLIVFSIITWSVRIAYTYMYCSIYECYKNLFLYAIKQFSLIALDLNRIWRCFIFDVIRYRLKILRRRLEETPEQNYYLYVKNNKSIKENKLKFCLNMYRNIADLVDLVSPELHASLFLSVATSLPKLIYNVYHILTVIENYESSESLSYVILHTVQISLLLFSPFVAVEFYSVEVDKIRLFLIHRLIDDNDPNTKEDIEIFLQYTQIRTFRYKILRMIPINISLPLELINLCVNYVIVVVNFTHLYD